MSEAVKMNAEQLKDHILATMTPLISDMCGKVIGERVEEAVSKTFEEKAKTAQTGYPDFVKALGTLNKQPEARRAPGEACGRWLRAYIAGKSSVDGAIHWLKKWGDEDLAKSTEDFFTKDAMMATNPELGGSLIPVDISSDITSLLRPASIVRRLGAVVLPMPSGNLEIPKITQGSTAYYGGEGDNITPSKMKTGIGRLVFKKLTALVPVSNDLIRYSSPGADGLVRDDVIRAQSQRENQAFMRDDGVSSGGPRGMLHWAPADNKFSANATVNFANTVLDLGRLVLKLVNKNIPMTRPAWMISPQTWNYLMTLTDGNGNFVFRPEMTGGTLWGWPFAFSTAVPTTEIYLSDMADMIIGESLSSRVDSSSEAAYYDGSNVVAAFSKDQTVIRMISEHDFLARREDSVAVMQSVTWGN